MLSALPWTAIAASAPTSCPQPSAALVLSDEYEAALQFLERRHSLQVRTPLVIKPESRVGSFVAIAKAEYIEVADKVVHDRAPTWSLRGEIGDSCGGAQDRCSLHLHCVGGPNYPEQCHKPAEQGETCDGVYKQCNDGKNCFEGKCVIESGIYGACDGGARVCRTGFQSRGGVCSQKVGIGELCDNVGRFYMENVECRGQVCPVDSDVGGPCGKRGWICLIIKRVATGSASREQGSVR